MYPLSQFFILSRRGDVIVDKINRDDKKASAKEEFYRKIHSLLNSNGSTKLAPPVFSIDGTNFTYITAKNLYFVATTKYNISPVYILSLLHRISKILEDYCGVLSEVSLRKNFILVYELLDEIIDFGCKGYFFFYL